VIIAAVAVVSMVYLFKKYLAVVLAVVLNDAGVTIHGMTEFMHLNNITSISIEIDRKVLN
jgi:hypothetical protein